MFAGNQDRPGHSVIRRALPALVPLAAAVALLLLCGALQAGKAWAGEGDQLAAATAAAGAQDGMQLKTQSVSGGTWVRTSSGVNIPGATARDDRHYQYKFRDGGILDDGYVRLICSGGFYDLKNGRDNMTATYYHECSQPAGSYKAGSTASLTMRYFTQDSTSKHYNGTSEINCYDPTGAFFGSPRWGYFKNSDNGEYSLYDRAGYTYYEGNCPLKSLKVSYKFPESAEPGDKMDIVFKVGTASRYEEAPDQENGSWAKYNQFKYEYYRWSYTYKVPNTATLKAASKTYKRTALKKAKTFKIATTGAQGKVAYALSSKAKKAKVKVTSKGKVTIPRKCKKGTYAITVKVAGNGSYLPKTMTVKIRVR